MFHIKLSYKILQDGEKERMNMQTMENFAFTSENIMSKRWEDFLDLWHEIFYLLALSILYHEFEDRNHST